MTGADHRAVTATESVEADLERVVRRWQQLPLDHALRAVPGVHAVVQGLADEVAERRGRGVQPVPDLGPAVLMDQLRVMVHDYRQAGLELPVLASRLADLRRSVP